MSVSQNSFLHRLVCCSFPTRKYDVISRTMKLYVHLFSLTMIGASMTQTENWSPGQQHQSAVKVFLTIALVKLL